MSRSNGMELLLNKNLRRILSKLDWSIPQLSKKSGIPSTTIQNWAEGKPPRDMRQVKSVAEALGMSMDNLCFEEWNGEGVDPFAGFQDEINAGLFEVVLRRVRK